MLISIFKNYLKKTLLTVFALTIGLLMSCKEETVSNTLVVSRSEINIPAEGDTATILLQTDASEWRIQNPADWVRVDPVNGTGESASVKVMVSTKSPENRSAELTILAGTADPITLIVSQEASEFLYELNSSKVALDFKRGGNTAEVDLTTDAPAWLIAADVDWLSFSRTTGDAGTFSIQVTAEANAGAEARDATIMLTADYAPSHSIAVSQIGEYYPDYNTSPVAPDDTGMESNAMELAAKMGVGWNIGNTLEAMGGETAWGNPRVTEQLIKTVKANGFNSIRIPCAWDQYSNPTTAEIDQDWLNRVKQVVQYCTDNDMYALLNIHWDGGWLENNVTKDRQEANNAKQKAFWQQIATHLRDFDEHLIFASANEPHVENETQMNVLMSYHQTFIDAVRATGGKNAYRVLVVQGPSTDIEKTNDLMKSWPTDEVADRLMAEVHFYSPYQYCLMEDDASWGKAFYYWGDGYHSTIMPDRNADWGEEDFVDTVTGLMNDQFVKKSIPVILGEYGVGLRSNLTGDDLDLHKNSRAYYLNYFTKKCVENGMIPFYWDTGAKGYMNFTIFDRGNNSVHDPQILDAIIKGGNLEDL